MKMLLAEDSPADVMLVKLALESSGVPLQLQHFPDGEAIITHLRQSKPDDTAFILLDLNIPKANGIDILRHKRQMEAWKNVPVILYSSSSRQEDIMACLEQGANAYILKPVDFEQFNRTINHLLVFWGELNQLASGKH